MVEHVTTLVRLRWTLGYRALSRNAAQAVLLVILGFFGLMGTLAVCGGLLWMRGASLLLKGAVVVGFTLLTGLWSGLATVSATTSPGLGPRSFTLLPIPARTLAAGLLAGRLAQPTTAALLIVSLAAVVMWGTTPGLAVVALLAALLGVFITVLLAAFIVQVLDRLLTGRRGRALGTVVAMLGPAIPMVLNITVFGTEPVVTLRQLAPAAQVAGWTPFGWAWSLPLEVAMHRPGLAAVKGALCLGLVVTVWFCYCRSVASSVERLPQTSARRMRTGERAAGWASGPVGAIARRRILTWGRDDRMRGALLQLLFLPVLILVQSVVLDQPFTVWFGVYLVASAAGASLANDLAVDGTAVWMHLAAGVRGWQDRLGRVLAHLAVIGTLALLVALGISVSGLVNRPWRVWPVALVTLTATLGTGALAGAISVGNAPPVRGGSVTPPPGGTARNVTTGLINMMLPLVALLPVVLLIAACGRVLPDTTLMHAVVILVSLLIGGGVLVAGVVLGGRRLDSHGVDLLATLRLRG